MKSESMLGFFNSFLGICERAIIYMMTNKLCIFGFLLISMVFISSISYAQSAPIYNPSNSSYTTSGPLNLQQIIRGRQGSSSPIASQYNNQYYGGKNYRPYRLNDPTPGLSVTPDEIFAARSQRDREARAREQENLASLQRYNDELAAFEQAQQAGQSPTQVNQSSSRAPIQRSGRRVYNQEEQERFQKPRRVFNSLR